jgi:dephospho-CoA kinase
MTRPFLLGLTGSIGMGKSTTAAMFAEAGVPVWDADAAVHRLYAKGGAAVAPLAVAFPGALTDGTIDREKLKKLIARDPGALSRIEAIVHPLVAADRITFINRETAAGARLVVLDIPLLFETGSEGNFDATLVVSAPPEDQRARVMARPGMTDKQFDRIIARQMPDAEKRARATYVIETHDLESTCRAVDDLIARIGGGNA